MLASARCTVSEKQCHHEILATEKNIQWRKIMIENTSDEFLFKIFYHSMHCHFHTSFMIFWKLEIRKTSFQLFCQHSTSNLQMWRQTFVCQKFWGDFTFTISSFFFKKCLKISISRSRPISRKFHYFIFFNQSLTCYTTVKFLKFNTSVPIKNMSLQWWELYMFHFTDLELVDDLNIITIRIHFLWNISISIIVIRLIKY